MTDIKYLKGDATNPKASGAKIIAHVCNDIGKWGKGFVMAISKKWPQPKAAYLDWYNGKGEEDFAPGNIQLVRVTNDIVIANMIAQNGIRSRSNPKPINYEALGQALEKLGTYAVYSKSSIHMPRIGCGLAGGKWEEIEPLIQVHLINRGRTVYVYDFGD